MHFLLKLEKYRKQFWGNLNRISEYGFWCVQTVSPKFWPNKIAARNLSYYQSIYLSIYLSLISCKTQQMQSIINSFQSPVYTDCIFEGEQFSMDFFSIIWKWNIFIYRDNSINRVDFAIKRFTFHPGKLFASFFNVVSIFFSHFFCKILCWNLWTEFFGIYTHYSSFDLPLKILFGTEILWRTKK